MVDIIARLKIRAEEFSRGAKAAFGDFEKEAQQAGNRAGDGFARGLSARIDALATGAGVATMLSLGQRALDHISSLKKESAQLGINTQALQEYRYAAAEVGVEQADLSDSFADLTQKMGEARAGNKQAAAAFRDIGVDIESANGRGKAMVDVFNELIGRFSAVRDPAERARLEAQLFGDQWQKIDPILRAGAGRIDGLRTAAHDLGVVISEDAIQDADLTAHKLEQMKMVLEANIADTVAKNSTAILGLANSLAQMTGSLAQWWNQNPEKAYAIMGAVGGGRVGGVGGAVIGAVAGAVYGQSSSRAADDANMNLAFRRQQAVNAKRELDAMRAAQSSGSLVSFRRSGSERSGATVQQAEAELLRQSRLLWRAAQPRTATVATPTLTATPTPAPSGGSQSGGRGSSSSSTSEADRTLKAQQQAEERLRESLDETIQRQRDSQQLSDLRAQGLDREADIQEAMLEIQRQFPGLEGTTNKEAADLLGVREDQVDALRAQYELLKSIRTAEVNQEHDAEEVRARVEMERKAQEEIARQREEATAQQRRSMEDLSRYYFSLFSGRAGDIWRDFKNEGLEVISVLAAQWSIAMLTGQKFDPATALGGASGIGGYGGPASTLLSAVLGGRGNSIAEAAAAEGGSAEQIASAAGLTKGLKDMGGQLTGLNKYLAGVGAGQAVSGLAGAIGVKQSSAGSLVGSVAGTAIAGPIGGAIGGLVGGTLGGLLGGVLSPSRSAGATITGVDSVSIGGKDKANYGVASDLSASVISGLQDIADQLGGTVGTFQTTIGVRDGDYRVNTDGTSLKIKNGAVEFDDDAEGAIAYAIADAVVDGAIQGLSAASQRILTSGAADDLSDAIVKATLIESIPDRLKSYLDPVGYAIDQLNESWADTWAALEEGAATAEQMTEAQQLYNLELEQVKASTASAAQSLKDFLDAMNVGSSSPLSLRDQEQAAYADLAPFLSQIATGQSIDQAAYLDAAQTWLDIERQLYGSTAQYFDAFDKIQAATSEAIASIENVSSISTASDASNASTAAATTSMAADTQNMVTLLQQQNELLQQQVALLTASLNGSDYIGTGRNYI